MAFVGTFSPDVPLTNRNLVINGAMQVAQRGTSVTGITTNDYFTADRWRLGLGSAGTWTMNVESSAPTGTEFRKSANVICTTADSSLGASDSFNFQQRFEGQNLQGIKKGTANAESLTVSFWVKSSNTGTYICEFIDNDNNRAISKSYTIDTANTWEKKTITVPPDTTGQLDNDNALSLQLVLWLALGSNYTSGVLNDTAWASIVNANRGVGQLNLANRSGNYWAVTGVQLEIGTVATPYEWMDYGTELRKCQRYYWQSADKINTAQFWELPGVVHSSAAARMQISLQTALRAAPTVSINPAFNTGSGWNINVTGIDNYPLSSAPVFLTQDGAGGNGGSMVAINVSTASNMSSHIGKGALFYTPTGVNTNNIQLSAEL